MSNKTVFVPSHQDAYPTSELAGSKEREAQSIPQLQPIITKPAPSQRIPVQLVDEPSQHKLHIRTQKGPLQRLRTSINAFMIALFALVPFIQYNGRQAILFDLAEQQFFIFGTTLWPQDFTLLAWVFITAAFILFFVTVFWGRVWCGYLCPQTSWSFIFIWFETQIEGNKNKRHALDKAPWTLKKLSKRFLKHLCWALLAITTGCAFVSYFVPARELYVSVWSLNASIWVTFWVAFFAACTYLNAGWMREIMCLHCCPYARFQSVMFDANTKTVTYDSARGELRGPRKRKQDTGLGDCVDCNLCVDVCPTGIDIRHGLQYECISCGACIDACNQTMDKFGYAPGLIRYTSENARQSQAKSIWDSGRFAAYGCAIIIMLIIMSIDILNREDIQLNVLRDRQELYRDSDTQGHYENTYLLKIRNKTQQKTRYRVTIESPSYLYLPRKAEISIAAGEQIHYPITVLGVKSKIEQRQISIRFLVTDLNNPGQRVSQQSNFFSATTMREEVKR